MITCKIGKNLDLCDACHKAYPNRICNGEIHDGCWRRYKVLYSIHVPFAGSSAAIEVSDKWKVLLKIEELYDIKEEKEDEVK